MGTRRRLETVKVKVDVVGDVAHGRDVQKTLEVVVGRTVDSMVRNRPPRGVHPAVYHLVYRFVGDNCETQPHDITFPRPPSL